MATLQHALTRGIDIVFQLEESEMLSEPTPTRENRRAILAFEATEGGAGVLSRLVSEPHSVANIARAALELMHYENVEAAIDSGDPADLQGSEHANCVKGCYRCLLSYFNQPDHELIDRTDPDALLVLLRLARSTVTSASQPSMPRDAWGLALDHWKVAPPDAKPLSVAGASLPLVWRLQRIVAVPGGAAPEVVEASDGLGFTIINLPHEPGDEPPAELVEHLRETA